jgi:hypothetical protein
MFLTAGGSLRVRSFFPNVAIPPLVSKVLGLLASALALRRVLCKYCVCTLTCGDAGGEGEAEVEVGGLEAEGGADRGLCGDSRTTACTPGWALALTGGL